MKNAFSFADAIATLSAHYNVTSDDMQAILNPLNVNYGYTEHVHAKALELVGEALPGMLKLPQKQIKRFVQMVNALTVGIPSQCDFTHARLLLSLRAAGEFALNRDAVHALTSNTISPDANTRGITRGAINQLFDLHHGASTVETKISNSAGKNGYMTVLGMVQSKGARNAELTLNHEHPVTRAFFAMIDGATLGQLQALADKGKKKAKA